MSTPHGRGSGSETPPALPRRPGEIDCPYFMRTGTCGYGPDCKFHHPEKPAKQMEAHSEGVVVASTSRGVDMPLRPGQPECQFYLRTGTCKFGPTCKFHHPKDREGGGSRTVALNHVGLPLRPGEKECGFYMRTWSCKFGHTCRFNHPGIKPGATMGGRGGSLLSQGYQGLPAGTSPMALSGLPGGPPSWPQYLPRPLPQGSQAPPFASLMLSPRVPQLIGWAPAGHPPGQGGYGGPHQYLGMAVAGPHGQASHPSASGAAPTAAQGGLAGAAGGLLPERPGQPECKYYVKTGLCKFGGGCRYHHPPECRATASPPLLLNPVGLPMRPGAQACTYFSRHGLCKFGTTCKFDHPVGPELMYAPEASLALMSLASQVPRMAAEHQTAGMVMGGGMMEMSMPGEREVAMAAAASTRGM